MLRCRLAVSEFLRCCALRPLIVPGKCFIRPHVVECMIFTAAQAPAICFAANTQLADATHRFVHAASVCDSQVTSAQNLKDFAKQKPEVLPIRTCINAKNAANMSRSKVSHTVQAKLGEGVMEGGR